MAVTKSSLQMLRTHISNNALDPLTKQSLTKRGKLLGFMRSVDRAVKGVSAASVYRDTLCAYGTLTFSSTSGTIGCVINGVTLTFAEGASDQADSNTMVTTINDSADALVKNIVEADNRTTTITLTSTAIGTYFEIAGHKFVAVAKASDAPGTFEVSGTDTADAGTLVTAINTHPGTMDVVVADNSAGVVTVRSRRASTPTLEVKMFASGEVLAASVLTASTVVTVSAIRKGVTGNCITLAASGMGVTASGARLTGGTTTVETVP